MLGDISKADHVYIAVGYTDMRKGIDGLAAIVQQNFKLDPFSNSVYLFCGRKSSTMKALYCYINDWKMADSNGRVINRRLWKSHRNSLDG